MITQTQTMSDFFTCKVVKVPERAQPCFGCVHCHIQGPVVDDPDGYVGVYCKKQQKQIYLATRPMPRIVIEAVIQDKKCRTKGWRQTSYNRKAGE